MFTHGVSKNFPEWKSTIENMRKSSLNEFTGSHPNFVQDLKKALGKESEDSLTLGNAIFYLDYYNMAIADGQTPTKASISGSLLNDEKDYYKAFFGQGFLGKDAYNTVWANAYLKHVVNLLTLKKQDLEKNDLQDKRIHELKASLDFGSKLTLMAVLKSLGQEVKDYGYTFKDTLTWELVKDGSSYKVHSMHNGDPMDLGSSSSGGVTDFESWQKFMISKMYYGSITDLQKDSGAEDPEHHLTRDGSETEVQWWAKQKKYEDRVLLKKSLDTTALPLETIDKGGEGSTSAAKPAEQTVVTSPSSSQVTVGTTSSTEAATAIATDLNIADSSISGSKKIQFNTLDKVGNFERTNKETIDIAAGEQVSLGLDNVETKDVQTNKFKTLNLATSKADDLKLSNTHQVRLDGTEATETVANGKAVQINHYVPIEISRDKAKATEDNTISLSGADQTSDKHTYSGKSRQNTVRTIGVTQGEHYKVDLSKIDPENAAVTRTSAGSDSVHLEGSSKTKPAGTKPPAKPKSTLGHLKIGGAQPGTVNIHTPKKGHLHLGGKRY